jgi:hypothetical protein
MFGTRQRRINRRPKHVRARDGHVRRTSSERRRVRKAGGLSGRAQKRVVKERRRYRKG